jgi:signal transduction histidine kinase
MTAQPVSFVALEGTLSDEDRPAEHPEQPRLSERERLEALVNERTADLEQSKEMFRLMAESTRAIPFILHLETGCFSYIGGQAFAETGIDRQEWHQHGALDHLIPRQTNKDTRRFLDGCEEGAFEFVAALTLRDGGCREMRWTGTCDRLNDLRRLRGLMLDITELRRLSRELAAAQKLESLGRLASGVAHEINTPVQFVTDNINFIQTSVADLTEVLSACRQLQCAVREGGDAGSAVAVAEEVQGRVDLDYLMKEIPQAIAASVEGLNRIAMIVKSMKSFAHPDQTRKSPADLKQAILSTLIIAANEYKYVADVETILAELPTVQCYLGEINQVMLNLIVNASHAIADVFKVSGQRGRITIRTRLLGEQVEISIQDTGTGIPIAVREKIFDPFFTTKEVGRGTGQGLALAQSVIAKMHGGTLHFETAIGRGTTFFIRIPVLESGTEASPDVAA